MASVCVLGKNIRQALFGKAQPVGESISIGGSMFSVVGLIDGMEDPMFDDSVLIRLSVARSRFAHMYEIRDVYVRAVNWDIVPTLQQQIFDI